MRYRTNKLVKNFTVRMFRTEREDEVTPHLERFFAMHQDRWTAEGHPGSFYSDAKRAFYVEVSREFLRRGWLRFYHLEVDGTIRASQFGFAFNGILHSLQEAFDRDFHPPGVGGVGVVLRGMAIKACIDEGIQVRFPGRVKDFKRWGPKRTTQRVRASALRPSGSWLCGDRRRSATEGLGSATAGLAGAKSGTTAILARRVDLTAGGPERGAEG